MNNLNYNNLFINNIGDLNEIQSASYFNFIYKGITEEVLLCQNPFFSRIENNKIALIYLYPQDIKFSGPQTSINHCLTQNLSYTIKIYIKSYYSYLLPDISSNQISTPTQIQSFLSKNFINNTKIKIVSLVQDLLLGECPLITNSGTFIINGYERIIISQIIRSPGVYFLKSYNNFKTNYVATLISNKGLWTKIILNTNKLNQDQIYIKINNEKNIKNLPSNKFDLSKIYLLDILKLFNISFEELIDNLESTKYLNSSTFLDHASLSTYLKLHNIINLTDENLFSEENDFYESLYVFETYKNSVNHENSLTKILEELLNSKNLHAFSIGQLGRYNLNNKFNLTLPKTITTLTCYDLFKIIDNLFFLKYENKASDDIDDLKNKTIRSIGELLQIQLNSGLYAVEKQLIKAFDTAHRIHKNIINPLFITNVLKKFFISSELSQFMDQTNPLAEITHKRKISLFGPNGLKRDQISIGLRDIHVSQYGRFCSIDTPEGQNAGLINSLTILGRINALNNIDVPYFYIKKGTILTRNKQIYLNPLQENNFQIAFTDLKNLKTITQNIPCVSIKSKQSFLSKKLIQSEFIITSPLQILSLATSLIPFIEHDDTNRALMGANMQRQAIPTLYSEKAIVGTGLEPVIAVDSNTTLPTYAEGKIVAASAKYIKIKDILNKNIIYYLKKYTTTNQNTCFNQTPLVWPGEKVFSNQLIADNTTTNNGELALGRNLLIGYMPWEGYNYEDAIVINERLVTENILTSIYIEDYESKFNNEVDQLIQNNEESLTLTSNGIIKIGTAVQENSVLIKKFTYKTKEDKLSKTLNYRDTSLMILKSINGRVIDIKITYKILQQKILYQSIIISIAQLRKIQIGDKLAGRHGNKGIVARILANQDMPYLPDGTTLDLIFNPLGVPSRMNVGQIFETLLGFAAEKLEKRIKVLPFDEIYGEESSRVLINQKLKEAAIKTNISWIFNKNYPGKIFLQDGRTGEFFDNPITVGKSYILKLIHLVENKIHSRAVGPYTVITEQPLAGKAHKGGQRFGEMEIWALEAYGCSYTLQELLTVKSDDTSSRNLIYNAIVAETELSKSFISEAFLTLIRELQAIGLDFSLNYITNPFTSSTDIKKHDLDIFSMLETRLNLKPLSVLIKQLKHNIS
jgi:DNA-directed RNA polymerase subunit beta